MSDFVARTEAEVRLRRWLDRESNGDGFVELERVVSGAGLFNLYRWLLHEALHDEAACLGQGASAASLASPPGPSFDPLRASILAAEEPAALICRYGS
jgi:glucokinase